MNVRIVMMSALVVLFTPFLQAQERSDDAEAASLRWSIGVSIGGTYMLHGGGLLFPREVPPLIRYDDASGFGPAFGVRVTVPLTSSLALSPRLFAECRRGTFTSDRFMMEIIGRDLRPEDMTLEDELDVTLRVGGLDLLLAWHPADGGFYLAAGPSIGLRLYEEFRVTESIVSPQGVTFLDGSTEREMYDDDPGLTRSVHVGLRGGAGYLLPLNEDLALGCELLYLYPLQTVTENDDWTIQGLQGTVTLQFNL
ncbi:MAG: outer membrane beta-barrel protein [Bacteroidota bacterium]|nr:outer membrane beta-barrel protein [Bacteroidota bacterium]